MNKFISISVFVITLMAYGGTMVSPEQFWMAGFLALSVPVLLILNIVLLLYNVISRKKTFVFPLLALLLGYQHLMASFSLNPKQEAVSGNFSVLNYNVRVFNAYAHLQNENNSGKSMIEWVMQHEADIKCLQEYYNEDTSKVYNVFSKIRKQQYHAYVQPSLINQAGAQFGLAIFSKFPILSRGELFINDDRQQYVIYADLLVQGDTIRVYNVHLQSMSIDENKMSELEKARENYTDIARKLRYGFVSRARQVDRLLEHIRQSPYRTIVCGDFNDIPYSYTYLRLKKYLYNAFEEAGNGLGFSYNGKLFFLRIDNQFYSEGLQVQSFTTYREISYSDHFPVNATYRIE